MRFPTVTFACFFVAVFLAHWLTRPRVEIWRPTMTANLAVLGVFRYAEWLVVDVWNPLPVPPVAGPWGFLSEGSRSLIP